MESLLRDQLDYYEARAEEYNQWFLREGRYDRGEQLNRLWFDEIAQVQAGLAEAHPGGNVLELACGTGLWTERLLAPARSMTVVDGSAEMLEVHRRRIASPAIERVRADLFTWVPDSTYDFVFFGFWLSHVPTERMNGFLSVVRRALRPGGRFFLVDSKYTEASTARDHQLAERELGIQERKLNDGRTYRIVKLFWKPEELAERMDAAGLHVDVRETETFFLYASGSEA
jgi:demethylmenaquinone methyltransferase/2-methoxy-6-polyprenyl-1,4-benzoquinol methylase